uniref:Uncharacterized protein n=1 Tax=Octopus bimaculoides TaxID=37653 RepID=A0A0L8IF89_OCTBM
MSRRVKITKTISRKLPAPFLFSFTLSLSLIQAENIGLFVCLSQSVTLRQSTFFLLLFFLWC